MIRRRSKRLSLRALMINDALTKPTAEGRVMKSLVGELRGRGAEVVEAASLEDGMSVVISDSAIHGIALAWTFDDDTNHIGVKALLDVVRSRNDKVPIFLMADRGDAASISTAVIQMVNEFVWALEDTTAFVGGRILSAMRRYARGMVPPLASAIMELSQEYEYSWHTPGHTGGTAFLKSPVGRLFFDYFGENLLRSDVSIVAGSLGSLLDHSGAVGEHERYAARVFGAHRTYCVTNGTSAANRIILTASVGQDQVVLCDRNCHKSIEHGLVLTGGIPTYMLPLRNRFGIIGPIPPAHLAPNAIAASIGSNPLVAGDIDPTPVYSVVTNSTYDGLCYDARRVEQLLDQSVDRIHFDEAWYAYARFNPLYRDRYAMRGNPRDHRGPTVFATHSTHKLLAALSQASFLHVRDGRRPIPHTRFNESFMMHASTSPLYPIMVSNDIAAAMMDGPGGVALTSESIQEAVAFRQTMARIYREHEQRSDWFFTSWNPDTVRDARGKVVLFEAASPERLARDPEAWILRSGDHWHGFGSIDDGYCMLDPIKVSVVTPGVGEDGRLAEHGIPATLVSAYLHRRGVEVEKTTDFTILFLFSIGITKGKWGTLINGLLDFHRAYECNASLTEVLPQLVEQHPDAYAGLGLRDLADEMFGHLRETQQTHWLAEAFASLPTPVMSPRDAYQHLVRGHLEHILLDDLAGRVLATSVVPYPPGIPLLMPGEETGDPENPCLRYLQALSSWDSRFPGFEHKTHGVENRNGSYYVQCLTGVFDGRPAEEHARSRVPVPAVR